MIVVKLIGPGVIVHKAHQLQVPPGLDVLPPEIGDGDGGHEALADQDGVTAPLQKLVQAGRSAVFHGVPVHNQRFLLGQAAVRHGRLVGGDPLLGGGQPGQAAHNADTPLSPPRQAADTAIDGLEVGDGDRGVLLTAEGPVHQHHWKPGGKQALQLGEAVHSAGNQKPVHQPGGEEAEIRLFPLHVLLGVGNDEVIALGGEVVFRRLDDGAEKLVGNIGNDEADGFLLPRAEAPGGGVGGVAQLADGLIDPLLGLSGDVTGAVDGVGDGGGGNPCQPGHIADGDFHRRIPLRNRKLRLRKQTTLIV